MRKLTRENLNENVLEDEEEQRFNTFSSNNYWQDDDINMDLDIDDLIS